MMERRAPGTVLPTLSPRLLQLSSLIKFSNYYQANQNSDVRYSTELSKGKIKIKKKHLFFSKESIKDLKGLQCIPGLSPMGPGLLWY